MSQQKRPTTSQRIAQRVLAVDAAATFAVLGLCALSILRGFSGSLPYLTALIGALQVVTGVVLTAYFSKSKAENCRGGIVYDAALRPDDETV